MSTDVRKEMLKNKIINYNINKLEFKLNELLSICESEIEKLNLLQFYNLFQEYTLITDSGYSINSFENLEFIEDEIVLGDPFYTMEEKNYYKEKVNRLNYRNGDKVGMFFYKNIGFKCNSTLGEPIPVNEINKNTKFTYHQYEIYPQYQVENSNQNFRIDLALILKIINQGNNEILKTIKIAIECDGYEYHATREQFTKDKLRERKLKELGWKDVIRYSGSEIYQLNDDLEKTKINFDQILEIIKH